MSAEWHDLLLKKKIFYLNLEISISKVTETQSSSVPFFFFFHSVLSFET